MKKKTRMTFMLRVRILSMIVPLPGRLFQTVSEEFVHGSPTTFDFGGGPVYKFLRDSLKQSQVPAAIILSSLVEILCVYGQVLKLHQTHP